MPFGVPSTRTARTPTVAAARTRARDRRTRRGAARRSRTRRAPSPRRAGPRSRRRSPRAVALAVALVAVWLLVDPRTPDLAGAGLPRRAVPPARVRRVGRATGTRATTCPATACCSRRSAALIGRARGRRAVRARSRRRCSRRSAAGEYGRAARAGARWRSRVAAVGDVWIGRVAFALGVTPRARRRARAARAATRCSRRRSRRCAAAASPVAGLLLGLARCDGRARDALAARPARARGAGRGGRGCRSRCCSPKAATSRSRSAPSPRPSRVTARSCGRCRASERLLRIGALVYLVACVLCLLVHSPVGSNIERYGVLLGGAAAAVRAGRSERARAAHGARRAPGGRGDRCAGAGGDRAPGCCGARCARRAAVDGSPATSAAYYRPLERFLAGLGGGPVRVEVPLTRSHWEAALLAPHVALARGWEKQLDSRYDGLLLRRRLSASSYRDWLRPRGGRLRRAAGRRARPLERARGPPDRVRAALPAAGLREQPLARLPRRGAAPLAVRARAADRARPRHLRARRVGRGPIPRARALQPLLERARRRARAWGAAAKASPRCRARAPGRSGRGALLARAGARLGLLLPRLSRPGGRG